MVMPSAPISASASFTSSSLNGLMIASIFFIWLLGFGDRKLHFLRSAAIKQRRCQRKSVESVSSESCRFCRKKNFPSSHECFFLYASTERPCGELTMVLIFEGAA